MTEPALDTRGWALITQQGYIVLPHNGGTAQLDFDGGLSLFPNGESVDLFHPGERTMVAALCLHGQPFGFTWQDVDTLREYYEGPLNAVADKIEALLPPRSTTTSERA